MRGEGELNKVHEWPALPPRRFKDMPGRAAVLMCPKPETSEGGIYLTDRTSGNLRPDAGIVTASPDIPDGTRVYIRPFTGMLFDSPEGWYRLLGREAFKGEEWLSVVDVYEHIVAFDVDGEIVPSPGNVLVRPLWKESVILTVKPLHTGKSEVVGVSEDSDYAIGDIVRGDQNGDWLEYGEFMLVPERSIAPAEWFSSTENMIEQAA